MKKLGKKLKFGDTVDLWFDHEAIVYKQKPYDGPLKHLFPKGAQIMTFVGPKGKHEMTVENDHYYEVKET